MAKRDDPQLSTDVVGAFARNGSNARAWHVRSLAQEVLARREWDTPAPKFTVSEAEQRIIEGLRAMKGGRDGQA